MFYLVKDNYTTLTDFNTNYLVMCKIYTDVGGISYLNHVCQPVREIIHLLKLVDYLHITEDKTWYNSLLHVITMQVYVFENYYLF